MQADLPRGAAGRVAVIVDRYPCLSESFVRREVACLKSLGLTLAVFTCSPASRSDKWPSDEVAVNVFRPDESPQRAGLSHAELARKTLQELPRALTVFPPRLRGAAAAGRAAWTAAAIRPLLERWNPDWLHAHFLGMPAATAFILSHRLNLPFSVSAHARDVFVPEIRVTTVCARARFVCVCSEHARTALMSRLPAALVERIMHVPHDVVCGLTVSERERADDGALRLVSVCRLVPKKGLDVVLEALALLPSESPYRYHYRIVGSGPELPRLAVLARELKLDCVEFVGPVPPEVVQSELAQADIFVLGTRTMPDGDRDGIPNALLEAMAAGIPVIAGDAGGVSEIVRHRHTGWLLPPNDPRALADALQEVASNHSLRRRVVSSAHAEIRRRFAGNENGRRLADRLTREIEVTRARAS